MGRDRFRREGGVRGVRRQCAVQLCRAPPEELGQIDVVTHQVFSERARLVLGELEQGSELLDVG